MKRGTCEFCGARNVEIDREHVCPAWMGKTILRGAVKPQLRIGRGAKTIFQTTRGISSINITTHCACKRLCNNGWMNRLLAAWGVKMGMVHEFSDRAPNVYFHRYERKHLKSWSEPPDDVWGWIGHSLLTSQAYTWPVYLTQGENALRRPSLYVYTLAAGHFLMQMLAYRPTQWRGIRPKIDGGQFSAGLIRLWPPARASVTHWPPPIGISDSSIVAFQNRFWGGKVIIDGVYTMSSPRDRDRQAQ